MTTIPTSGPTRRRAKAIARRQYVHDRGICGGCVLCEDVAVVLPERVA